MVFERFTPAARQVAVCAQEQARSFAHPWIGTEHLLLGVLATANSPATGVLAEVGVTLETARATVDRLVGRGGFKDGDVAALRAVGIELDDVRRAAEATSGPGALDLPPVWRCRRSPRSDAAGDHRRRRRENCLSCHAPSVRSSAVVEAERSPHGDVGVEHLLLGLLDPKGNMAVELIRQLGSDPDVIRTRVRARLEEAA